MLYLLKQLIYNDKHTTDRELTCGKQIPRGKELHEIHLNTSGNKTIPILSWGSTIAEGHDLSFLIAVKQSLPQMSSEGLQIISTELIFIPSLVFNLEGWAWQEPEPSHVTGMALAHYILGKFLGVVCHCFPPPLDVPTLAARCLRPQRRERS